jgi:uncharacterized membrane protein
MNTKKLVVSYLLTFIVFLIVDMLWLGVFAKNLYQNYLSDFLSDDVNWVAAFIFYSIYIVGISIFAIYPAVNNNSVSKALIMGALFGFFTYATYDLTNLATLNNWPILIVFVDIIWGTFLSAIVSISGFYIAKWIN